MDNRPLKFEEFEAMQNQYLCFGNSSRLRIAKKRMVVVVEQVIRPTGLLDPVNSTKFKSNR
jgi:excinuclease ABC subunit B